MKKVSEQWNYVSFICWKIFLLWRSIWNVRQVKYLYFQNSVLVSQEVPHIFAKKLFNFAFQSMNCYWTSQVAFNPGGHVSSQVAWMSPTQHIKKVTKMVVVPLSWTGSLKCAVHLPNTTYKAVGAKKLLKLDKVWTLS